MIEPYCIAIAIPGGGWRDRWSFVAPCRSDAVNEDVHIGLAAPEAVDLIADRLEQSRAERVGIAAALGRHALDGAGDGIFDDLDQRFVCRLGQTLDHIVRAGDDVAAGIDREAD